MAVPIETEPSFAAGNSEFLFEGYFAANPARTYDVSPNGERFLMIKPGADTNVLAIVVNWFEHLRAPALTDN